ncbi:MAG TPA: hypothetical protein VND87_11130 [Stellaceae bacterium]|nr:hypothetical protein [Stellaceae bacterium]
MADTFREFITRERERLHAERESIFNKQQQLEADLAEINRELSAIDAYEAVKTGKAAPPRQAATGRGQPRARRGSKREQILEVIRASDGLSRSEILEKMGLKGDKAGEMSVSNALTALIKANQVARRDGRYIAA